MITHGHARVIQFSSGPTSLADCIDTIEKQMGKAPRVHMSIATGSRCCNRRLRQAHDRDPLHARKQCRMRQRARALS